MKIAMKQVLLIIVFFIFSIPGFTQDYQRNLSGVSNNSWGETDKNQPELKLYPNPSKDKKVTIEFNSGLLSEIRFINITGKEIYLKKIEVPANRIQMELAEIPNGIYMVQVLTADNKTFVKKLVLSAY